MKPNLTIIYVLGRGRSGSTFLERRAAKVLEATMLGEVRLWPSCYREDHICGCGAPKTECNFWTKVIDGLPDKDSAQAAFRKTMKRSFLLSLFVPQSLSKRIFQSVVGPVADLYLQIAKTSARATIIDSSKNPAYALLLDQANGVDLHLVHVVRHPLGVVYSWKRQRKRSQDVALYRQRKSLVLAALEWNFSNALSGLTKLRARNDALTIRYEDLGVGVTDELLAKLSNQPTAPDNGSDDLDHVMSGNPGSAAKSDAFSADEEWKSGLRLWEKLVYGALTYPVYLFIRPTK